MMTADEARKIVEENQKLNFNVLLENTLKMTDLRIKEAATKEEFSIGMDWKDIPREIVKSVISHYEDCGFRVCCADDASYIGWHKR